MTRKHIFVERQAVNQAIKLGIVPNSPRKAERKLAEMAVNSAAFTHPRANRRYEDIGLLVVDNTVKRVIALSTIAPSVTRRRGKPPCVTCGGSGAIQVPKVEAEDPGVIACPDCK